MNDVVHPGLHLLACSYISRQLEKLMKHLQGAHSAEDSEDVHQVRVACRRIGAAIRLFSDCFDAKLVAMWQKQLKKLLKSFGAARDLDVQIAFLAETVKQLSSEQKKLRPGIRRMLLRRQQERDAVQAKVVKSIQIIQKKQVLTSIHLEMQKYLFILKPQKPSIQSSEVHQRAYEQIRYQLGELLDRRPAMEDPVNSAGHHSMRIAAKKLRYVMEIANEAMEDRLKSAIRTIKHIQTLLGDIHDCDVWNRDIEAFIQDERQRTVDFYGNARGFSRILPGLEYLKSERQSRRMELFEQAHDHIEQLEQQTFWEKLLEMLQSTFIQKGILSEDAQNEQTEPSPDVPKNSDPI